MSLIKSISGIRGTIGGQSGDNLTPIDIVELTSAFAAFLQQQHPNRKLKLVVGRDARISGDMVSRLVCGTLQGMGADVIDTGLSTTPTTEMAVLHHQADGGVIVTASHNPMHWNALKLLNDKGEFLSDHDGKQLLALAASRDFQFPEVLKLGQYTAYTQSIQDHINEILKLPLVNVEAIRKANYRIIVDTVNSTGSLSIPTLLKQLGVQEITVLNEEPNGCFAHNPEPIPENLQDISNKIKHGNYDLGIVVDPDVDRLAFIKPNGEMFGEEYTLVAVSDYILKHTPGNTVSNLSSTRALREVSHRYGVEYNAAAVGEVNVVEKMKATQAVIGGEGNGGVIYPELHYGRDALVGVALFLSFMATTHQNCEQIRASYPEYFISKNKIELDHTINIPQLLSDFAASKSEFEVSRIDGVKVDFPDCWVHVRSSNTEPILRIYAEAHNMTTADQLAQNIISEIKQLIHQ